MSKKVGVIIPVYNVEDYLKECLDSVISQTLKDLEIIIINDGSKDNSLKIINKYASIDERIHVINKANSGYGDSMNKGLELAYKLEVEYIAIMEPDDYISRDGYENLYKMAKDHDVDLLRANLVSVFYDDKGEINYFNNSLLRNTPDLYNQVLDLDKHREIFRMNSNCAGLFKTSFLKDNGIWFNTTPGASYQDIGFWFQSYCFSKRLYFSDKRYYHYRRNRPGASENAIKDIFVICKETKFMYQFLNDHPELKEKYLFEYYRAKYEAYNMVLQKISEDKWLDFLNMIASEFLEAINKGELRQDRLKEISLNLEKIIASPSDYLRENLQVLQANYRSVFVKAN